MGNHKGRNWGRGRQRAGLETGSASGAKSSPAGRVILRTALPSWSWQCVLAERGLRSFPRLAGGPGTPLFHAQQKTRSLALGSR